MVIKAIETRYSGYRFRSRLEARWAVFFDAMNVTYEYEPQGFKVVGWQDHRGWNYLPDFYLPDTQTWVEVKGSLVEVTDDYLDMIAWAIDWGGCLPGVADSCGDSRGLLWLGSIPDPHLEATPAHVILQHSKGGCCRVTSFRPGAGVTPSHELDYHNDYFDASAGAHGDIRAVLTECVYNDKPWVFHNIPMAAELRAAYRAARSARFEHGEEG